MFVMIITLVFPLVNAESVPDWVKNTAGWWATDAISETEFVNAIEFLINVGIIQTEYESKCVKDILKFFNDKQEITDACEQHESNIIELRYKQLYGKYLDLFINTLISKYNK